LPNKKIVAVFGVLKPPRFRFASRHCAGRCFKEVSQNKKGNEVVTPSDLDQVESVIRLLEEATFGEGPFSAKKVEENLRLIEFSAKLASQTGRRSNAPSMSEKKSYYNETLDQFGETISPMKTILNGQLGDSRASSLLQRYEKCEQEISKIRDVMRRF
jgi:hypothetical protein